VQVFWVVLEVVPIIFFSWEGEPPQVFKHSVLFAQMAGGESFMFDCTGKQFGWPGFNWLTMDVARHLKDVMADWDYSSQTSKLIWGTIRRSNDGYWRRAFESIQDMLGAFKWDKMTDLDYSLVERLVRHAAEARADIAAVETWG
jgi:hypothetical protein